MIPIATTESGGCAAMPDVCLTPAPPAPPIPVPYPNQAQCSDGAGADKVSIRNAAVLRVGDKISRTSGDEAGNAPGGVVSGRVAAEAEFLASPQVAVKAQGKLVAVQGAPTLHNSKNAPGAHVSASQGSAKIGPSGGGGGGGDDPVDDVDELLACVPTLQSQIEELRSNGWAIRYGKAGAGTEVTRYSDNPLITIDPLLRRNRVRLLDAIAHEAGHARHGKVRNAYPPDEEEFVRVNSRARLRSEGAAIRNECRIREEMRKNCPDQDMPVSIPECWDAYREEPDNLDRLADICGRQQPSGTPPGTTYAQFYERMMRDLWPYVRDIARGNR